MPRCRNRPQLVARILGKLWLAALPLGAAAQPAPEPSKSVEVTRVGQAPVIDGSLDEAVWMQARPVSDFHQIEPTEFATPSEPTEVYLIYDDEALYIGARLSDSDPERITAQVLRQGEPMWTEDSFTVILDPLNNRRSGVEFQVNPNGVRNEALYQNTRDLQSNWDGVWRAAATQTADGWIAEMAIPFKTLSFDPGNDTWGINFGRRIARKAEEIGWVSRNRRQDPSIAGVMVGIGGLTQGRGLDIVPSASLRENRRFSPQDSTSQFEPSLDIFYKLTPLLNGSLTFNTDFSATEVDDRQVNLTRFSLFFPEKRDFFLKDADVFEFGRIGAALTGDPALGNLAASRPSRQNGRPFFSRSIGLSPGGEPIGIDGGGKLTGRVGRWNVGALAIRQEAFENIEATDIFVGRAAANVLAESTAGILVTSGDPSSNVDNSVVGFDFNYLNTRLANGRTLEGEVWFQQSDTEGLESEDSAYGFGLSLPSRSGLRAAWGIKELEENFNPALGFVNNLGIRDHTFSIGYSYRFVDRYIRSFFGGLDAQRIDLLDGVLQSQTVRLRLAEMENNTADELGFHINASKEVLVDPFEIADGIVIPVGEYSFDSAGFAIETSSHRPLAVSLEYETGDFYDGQQEVIAGDISWRPSPHFRGSVGWEYNDIELPQGSFITRLTRVQLGVVFSTTLSWINLIQYDNVSDTIGINSRLHWIPEAGREAFFVINHNLADPTDSGSYHSTSADVVLKFSYMFRF